MRQNSDLVPLNWQKLVKEALRRRKAEKLTQRQHAALAGVSIPTLLAFDKGETTLSLQKAFNILRIVGLYQEPQAYDEQDTFAGNALERWFELLDTNNIELRNDGYVSFDCSFEGCNAFETYDDLEKTLEQSAVSTKIQFLSRDFFTNLSGYKDKRENTYWKQNLAHSFLHTSLEPRLFYARTHGLTSNKLIKNNPIAFNFIKEAVEIIYIFELLKNFVPRIINKELNAIAKLRFKYTGLTNYNHIDLPQSNFKVLYAKQDDITIQRTLSLNDLSQNNLIDNVVGVINPLLEVFDVNYLLPEAKANVTSIINVFFQDASDER